MRLKPLIILLSTALAVVVVDQASKAAVRASIPLHQPIWLVPGFLSVTHVQNLGAAFSLFQGQRWFFVATAFAVLAVVGWVWWRYRPTNLWIAAALGLAVGGAVGNLIDRLSAGTVTDFIDFQVFPVFNVADSAIVVGVAILMVWLLFARPDEDDADGAATGSGPVADRTPPATPDGPGVVTPDEVHEHVVTAAEEGTRLDRLVADLGVVPSRSAASRLSERGMTLVDGVPAGKKHLVREGEQLTIVLPPPAQTRLVAQELPLDIRYEDEDLIVLSKPAGLVVHPAAGHADGTLVNALLAHCGESLGGAGGSMRPGLVHRLDKDTSGLMMIAKNDAAQAALARDLRARRVDRRYLALVNGLVDPDSGVIDAPVGRRPSDRMKMAVTDTAGSREARTTFRVLERFATSATDDGFTLVECRLQTGRTHQVRVHMAFAGHPVVGDPLYGRAGGVNPWGLGRQFLHAWRLSFDHPRTQERLEFSDLPPEDLAGVLDALDPRSSGRTGAGTELLGPGAGRDNG